MLEGILDLVKNEALSAITGNADVPADKQDAAVETTTSTIVDGLKNQLSFDNIGAITSLLGGNGATTSNPIVTGIQNSVASALTSKVGLNQGVSTMIASTVVPAIFNLFMKKNNDPNDSGFNVESLIKSFTGGNDSSGGNIAGGILGALGNLFGGNK